MGDKSIRKEKKQQKKVVDVKVLAPSTYVRPIVTQPELIRKKKKDR